MGFQNIWYSHPRKYGQGSRSWLVTNILYINKVCESYNFSLLSFFILSHYTSCKCFYALLSNSEKNNINYLKNEINVIFYGPYYYN